jgi:hypothetical protein
MKFSRNQIVGAVIVFVLIAALTLLRLYLAAD